MVKLSRLAGVLIFSATLAATGMIANAAVAGVIGPQIHMQPLQGVKYIGNGWWNDNGVVYHTPHYMLTRQQAALLRVHPDLQLVYSGGPVLAVPHMYLILWHYSSDPQKVGALLQSYGSSMGGSAYNNIVTQYYGPGSVFISNPSPQLLGVWSDARSIPSHPTDGQVAAEALRGVAHFGYDANGSYVVATAHGHSSAGFGSSFCAYHSATTSRGRLVSYTNLPYIPDAGANCGSGIISPPSDESSSDEGVTIVGGHEYAESVTDPNPPTGWYNSSQGEIGDICAWQNIQNDPFGSKVYTSQPEWSNANNACVHHYP